MKAKAFLVVLLFLIWSLASGWYYVCKVKEVCPSNAPQHEVPSITFDRGGTKPFVNSNFEKFKSSLLQKVGDSNKLEIIGLYDKLEPNTTSFKNLGIARAMEVEQLFGEDISTERISISAEETNFAAKLVELDGVKFNIIKKRIKTEQFEETDFGAVLYLNEDLTKGTIPVKVEAFLKMLKVDNKDKQMDVVGHTDDSGGEGDNFELGLQRANMIREALIAAGVNPEKITANSKGQTEPVADNSTEIGRAKNRRVEILIN